MKYRVITCYKKPKDNTIKDIYFKVEAITDKQAEMSCFRLASPKYEYHSEDEAIKSLKYSKIPVVLLSGEIVIPFAKNYPKEYEMEEILKLWNPGIKEIWPGEDGYE